MSVEWLVEPEVFEEDAKPLLASLQKLGVKHRICKFGIPYEDHIARYKGDHPVVLYGCFQFGELVKKQTNHITVYCNLPKLECLYYYPRFAGHLLNENYVMLPFGELVRKKDWINKHIGESVFIRPSSGCKPFPGMTMNNSSIEQEIKKYSRIVELHELAVVAPCQEIKREWRIVVVNKEVITGGQYKEDGKIVRKTECSDNVMQYAWLVANSIQYQPDPAWTLDICEVNGELKVLEVGSFSCAGLYACDTDAVVNSINSFIGRTL